jgi:aminoglycoside phosphotransferase (APT) family kinase protein
MQLPGPVAEWVIAAVGGGSIVRVRRFADASTSSVEAVDVATPSGRIERLVLRRYDRPEVLDSEPEPIERETAVLAALASTPVPAPRVVATDPDGQGCGVPALLMTRLPGRARWRARHLDGFVEGLAAQLPAIHDVAVPTTATFPGYHRYYPQRDLLPPSWTRDSDSWETAIAAHARAALPDHWCFIHRDYHSGNVLWQDGRVSGIVDWAWACRGPQLVDVAHCRLNLVLAHGMTIADEFLRAWQSIAGVRDYDPTWDLVDAVDMLPDLVDSTAALRRLDDFVARTTALFGH